MMMMTQARKYLQSIIPEKVRDALDAEALLVLHLGGVRGGGGRVEEAGHVVGDGLEAVALGVRRLPGAQHRGHPGQGHGHLGIVYPLVYGGQLPPCGFCVRMGQISQRKKYISM